MTASRSILAISVMCFIWGIINRFWNILDVGITGSDAFYYWDMAYKWSMGDLHLTEHYRPFIYSLYALTLKIFGTNDWAIKLMNVIYDTLNGFLVYYVYRLYLKNKDGALLAASLYFLVPAYTFWARQEEVHTSSTLFVLLTLVAFRHCQGTRRSLFGFITGLALSCAWNIHPDLIVISPVIMYFLWRSRNVKIELKIFDQIVFLLGVASVFLIFCFSFHPFDLVFNILKNQSLQTKKAEISPLIKFLEIYYLYVKDNLGQVLFWSFNLSIIYLIRIKAFKVPVWFFLGLIIFYEIMCTFLFSRIYIPRLMIPLSPLILMLVALAVTSIEVKKWQVGLVALLFSGVLIEKRSELALGVNHEESIYRKLEADLFPKLAPGSKMVVAPFIVYHIHTPLRKKLYLGGRADYLEKAEGESVEEVISMNNFRYVFWSKQLNDHRILKKNIKKEYTDRLQALYGLTPEEYTVQLEWEILSQKLKALNAKEISNNDLGVLFEINKG